MKPMNIAIDGPAGAGKSTIAKALAKKRNMVYVDTGAMYRAMALYFLRHGIAAEDTEGIERACEEIDVSLSYENGEQIVWLNGENVNAFIRTQEVSNMTSAVSVNGKVRAKMVALQQKLAREHAVVMDGRDIGTCVLPDAELKIYLTASVEVRAKRRFDELAAKGESHDFETLKQEIAERDERDMHREISPLRRADDAVLVDSSDMTVEEVVAEMERLAEQAAF